MSLKQEIHFCKVCKRRSYHMVDRPNHVLHLILSLLSGGLWIPLWIWFSIGCKKECINHL